MGDMADYHREDLFYMDEEYDQSITCKYCGQGGFYWSETSDGWRLFDYDNDDVHNCDKYHRE